MRVCGVIFTVAMTWTSVFHAPICEAAPTRRLKYSELMTKDYDEMATLMRQRLQQAKAANTRSVEDDENDTADQGPAVEALREAMILVLSRPDQDNMVAKLIPEIRKELISLNSLEDVLSSVTGEAIRILKDSESSALPAVHRATMLFVLENLLGEFKPDVGEKEEIRRIFEQIRDANIEVPKAVEKEIKMRSMLRMSSPSLRAKKILETTPFKSPKTEK